MTLWIGRHVWMRSRSCSGAIREADCAHCADAGKCPQPDDSCQGRGRELAVARRPQEGTQQAEQQEPARTSEADQANCRRRTADRGLEAQARQGNPCNTSQEPSGERGEHAAVQGHNALGLPDMRHADTRGRPLHSGTKHARTRLASKGAKLEPRRRPEVPHSGEGAHGLDGVGCPHDGHGTTKTAGSSSIHQKAAVRG